MSAYVGLTPAAVGECTVARYPKDGQMAPVETGALCLSCNGAGGRMVADSLDGGSPDYRYEACEDCSDYAAELAEDERLDRLVELECGIRNLRRAS